MYPLAVRAENRIAFLLWESDEESIDRVLADGGRLVSFSTREMLQGFAETNGIELEGDGEITPVDLDAARAWLAGGQMPSNVDLLSVWNLAGDVARGTGQIWPDRGEDLDGVYELLFLGSNLPAVTPEGEQFTPDWTDFQLLMRRAVIERGVSMISRSLGPPAGG